MLHRFSQFVRTNTVRRVQLPEQAAKKAGEERLLPAAEARRVSPRDAAGAGKVPPAGPQGFKPASQGAPEHGAAS